MVSIDPKIWGPSAWRLLHDISFYVSTAHDEKIMEKAAAFFKTLRYVLPCTVCQYSFDVHLLHMPFPSKPSDIPRWVFDLHNRVNDSLARRVERPDWETWVAKYPSELARHRLRDVWPFIQSVVEVHPGKGAKGLEAYSENLKSFFEYLWNFLYNMDAYYQDKEILKSILSTNHDEMVLSKNKLRTWVTSIGKQIHSPQYNSTRYCNTTCHV